MQQIQDIIISGAMGILTILAGIVVKAVKYRVVDNKTLLIFLAFPTNSHLPDQKYLLLYR